MEQDKLQEIEDGLLQIMSEYGLRVLMTEGKAKPVVWRDKILQFLANKGLAIQIRNQWPVKGKELQWVIKTKWIYLRDLLKEDS